MPTHEIDVRHIPCRQKHPQLITAFKALAPGDAFILVNDHNPVPLRFQFEALRPHELEWDYIEEGPDVWRVRVGRRASATAAVR